ncbi:uncharacterized protein KQ657_002593 [Scheffersomyces spartinae]|uniref:Methyltransferase domain-containing protein n=1 Tax=Scheffersomyces spartinae TaxID=45513 RepID=A0A9P7V6C0_9ASCO|nr:uncharacterized protein KQ657_002593 [Scheffersomyces spartinae]KAG7191986.1 hypothetical protein KQ657_002593 [Scheffersomyces spartinae]
MLSRVGIRPVRGLLVVGVAAPVVRLTATRNYSEQQHRNRPFSINEKALVEQRKRDLEKAKLDSMPKWRQWAVYFQSKEFKKSMTFYYLSGFAIVLVCFYYYMRDRYYEDKQMDHIRAKYAKDPESLSEYEYLKLKALSGERLKAKEDKKFKLYQMMRKEFRRKNILEYDIMFEPTPQDLEEWYSRQARIYVNKAPVEDNVEEKNENENEKVKKLGNNENPHVMPPEDTTGFYESKAEEYDDAVKWEERGILMGRRRKWLMEQLHGDVLEVACGTGRNLKYLNLKNIDLITFLDSSEKMVAITQQKFREMFGKYPRVAFTVGKAEDLVTLAGSSSVKYDTIVEAFGLCAHEDPVAALKNMTTLLKPGGRIVLLEHGRGNYDMINNHLDFRSDKRMKTWACRWNLDIGELIDDAGLDVTFEKRVHFGTTWMMVCKRPEDPIALEEKPFFDQLFGRDYTPIKLKKKD